jgi:hypothetical protein
MPDFLNMKNPPTSIRIMTFLGIPIRISEIFAKVDV